LGLAPPMAPITVEAGDDDQTLKSAEITLL
jgi:hypothetical protein